MILLDTHVLVWLHGGERHRIPDRVQQRLNIEPLAISPFVRLELACLYEAGRVTEPSQAVLDDLGPKIELAVVDVPASTVCEMAVNLTWTRDPFDRLLAAHATVANLPLVTKDDTIRRHLPLAWWGN